MNVAPQVVNSPRLYRHYMASTECVCGSGHACEFMAGISYSSCFQTLIGNTEVFPVEGCTDTVLLSFSQIRAETTMMMMVTVTY